MGGEIEGRTIPEHEDKCRIGHTKIGQDLSRHMIGMEVDIITIRVWETMERSM